MSESSKFYGSGGTSAKFKKIGDSVSGEITQREWRQQRDYVTQELEFWDNGDPKMQDRIVLQTEEYDSKIEDDTGERVVYVKGAMTRAVSAALRKARAGREPEIGGHLTVTYTGDGKAERGLNPPKLFSAVYEPPAVPAAVGATDDDIELPPADSYE